MKCSKIGNNGTVLSATRVQYYWQLHRAGKESEIDRGEFDAEKSAYWQARFKLFSKSELERIYSK